MGGREGLQNAMILVITGDKPLPSRADSRTTNEMKREICTHKPARERASTQALTGNLSLAGVRACSRPHTYTHAGTLARAHTHARLQRRRFASREPTAVACGARGFGTAAQETAQAVSGSQPLARSPWNVWPTERPHSIDEARRRMPEQTKTNM